MLTPIFTHIPGLKVVCPSNAYDAKGLLIQSIRDNDPVIFCEHKNLYGHEADVPTESYAIPFGEANIVRDGKDVTIVTYGQMVHRALEAAAETLAKKGVDVRGDRSAHALAASTWTRCIDSVENTGRLVVRRRGPSALLHRQRRLREGRRRHAFKALKAGIQMVTAPHTPVPFSPALEDLYIPTAAQIVAAVEKTMAH